MTQANNQDFAALVRLHLPDAYRLALRLTGNPHQAEDITQEAFHRATKAWRDFEQRSSFKTWLFRIVVNTHHTIALKENRHEHAPPVDPVDAQLGPVGVAQAREFGELIAQTIGTLPHRQREILVLHVHQHCVIGEIAEILGISEQNVRVQLHLARKRMRELLAPYLKGD